MKSSMRRVTVNSICAAALVLAGLAVAVVNNVALVNQSTGQPVANATVTIVFPDGTEKTEETDDKGILIFDFPDNGTYRIRHPGGEMQWTVTGAGDHL